MMQTSVVSTASLQARTLGAVSALNVVKKVRRLMMIIGGYSIGLLEGGVLWIR